MTIYTEIHAPLAMANMNTLKIPSSPGGLSQASTEVASPSRTTPIDPTKDVNIPVLGWPTLANVIAQKSDLEAFPTFRDLNIKSLLYYQAELVHLRKKLHKAEWADFLTSDDESLASTYGDNLRSLFVDRDSSTDSIPLPEQWVLIEKIRTVLEKYSEPLQMNIVNELLTALSQRCCCITIFRDVSTSRCR